GYAKKWQAPQKALALQFLGARERFFFVYPRRQTPTETFQPKRHVRDKKSSSPPGQLLEGSFLALQSQFNGRQSNFLLKDGGAEGLHPLQLVFGYAAGSPDRDVPFGILGKSSRGRSH